MTDKHIIDGVDVSGCKNFYAKTKDCVQEDTIDTPCVDYTNCYYKQLKRKEQQLKKIEEFRHNYCMNCEDLLKPSHSCKGCNMVELKRIIESKEMDKQIIEYKHIKCTRDDCCHYCGSIFCGYVDDIANLEKAYKTKEQECETLASQLDFEVQKKECLEQECERLKKIINEAKNSKLDLKSFLVGESVQKEYEQQLDQLKAENSLRVTQLATKCSQLEKAIEKVRELIQNEINDCEHCDDCASCEYNCCTKQILQICDEVNDER